MNKYRIGNDVTVTWPIRVNGERVSLEGRKLVLTCATQTGHQMPVEWSVTGSDIRVTLRGREQRATGVYVLKLIENKYENDMHTIDVQAFELMPHSWQVSNYNAGCGGIQPGEVLDSLSSQDIALLRGAAEEVEKMREMVSSFVPVTEEELNEILGNPDGEPSVDPGGGDTPSGEDHDGCNCPQYEGLTNDELDDILGGD